MDILKAFNSKIKTWFFVPIDLNKTGPNTLEELLEQFDLPAKVKTQQEILGTYLAKEALAALEVEMLKMEKAEVYTGAQTWYDNDGNKYFDWVPVSTRPEVIYCSYGKN